MKNRIQIHGMHCINCEIVLKKELTKIPSLKKCKINHKNGTAEIICAGTPPMKTIKEVVYECGYSLEGEKQIKSKSKNKWLHIFIISIVLIVVMYVVGKLDITRFLPNIESNISALIALLMGIVAPLSTCLALTGGIVMSFGATVQVHEQKKHLLARSIPHIYFHAGRIASFVMLGGKFIVTK